MKEVETIGMIQAGERKRIEVIKLGIAVGIIMISLIGIGAAIGTAVERIAAIKIIPEVQTDIGKAVGVKGIQRGEAMVAHTRARDSVILIRP